MSIQKSPREDRKKKQLKSYLKYSGIAFQLIGAVILGIILGGWIDQWLGFELPIGTLVLTLLFILSSLYLVIKEFLK